MPAGCLAWPALGNGLYCLHQREKWAKETVASCLVRKQFRITSIGTSSQENDCTVWVVQAIFLFLVLRLDAFGYFTVQEHLVSELKETMELRRFIIFELLCIVIIETILNQMATLKYWIISICKLSWDSPSPFLFIIKICCRSICPIL